MKASKECAIDPEELSPLKNKSHVPGSTLFWLSWQFGAVVLFVVLGAGQAIATRISGNGGHLPYDSSAAVSFAEGLKLLIALGYVFAFDRHSLPWPITRSWFSESTDLFFVAALFALQNELNYLIVEKLGAALFMILGNLKIVFTCIFMKSLLNKEFAPLQWIAVGVLTMSAIVVKLPEFFAIGGHQATHLSSLGLLYLLISTASSGLASVKNELILKRETAGEPMPFMVKNAVLYAWGLGMNLTSWAIWGQHSIVEGFNLAAVVSIACLVGMGLSCAVMLRYLDNVVRLFSSVAMILATVALSRMLPTHLREGSFGIFYVISLVLLAGALVLYQANKSAQLPVLMVTAMAGAATVGLICMKLDAWMGNL